MRNANSLCLKYYFIPLCNASSTDLATEYVVNTFSKNKISIFISIYLIKKRTKPGELIVRKVKTIITKVVSLEKRLQTGDAQKGKLYPADPRLCKLHEFYTVQGTIPSNGCHLKLTD